MKAAIAQILFKPCFCSGNIDYLIEPFGNNTTSISTLSFAGDKKFFQKYKNNYINWIRAKIVNIVDYCSKKSVDVLVFPEYSIPVDILIDIEKTLKNSSMIVVAGTHIVSNRSCSLPSNYPDKKDYINYAMCPIIDSSGIVDYTFKSVMSQWETGLRFPSNSKKLIKTKECNLFVDICIESLSGNIPKTDNNCLWVIPSFSPTTSPFHSEAHLARYNEVPTLYVNEAKNGGSTIYATFSEHDSHWFVEKDHSVYMPKNTEGVIIAELNLDEMYKVKGSVNIHSAANLVTVANIYHRQDDKQKKIIELIEKLKEGNIDNVLAEACDTTDQITHKKLLWIKKRQELGLLTKEEISDVLEYIQINQLTYQSFIERQAEEMFKSLCGNIANVATSENSLENISILSEKLSNLKKKTVNIEDRYSEDKNLFTGRSSEISQISNFFSNPNTHILICQGLRGIGKSKLLRSIKPKIIPENSIYTLLHIKLTAGSGYEYLVDELFYILNSPVSDAAKRDPVDAAKLFISCLCKLENRCIIIDDFHFLFNHDNSFCDERTGLFFTEVFDRIKESKNKMIISTNRKLTFSNSENLFLSRLNNNEIMWIIRYCCQSEMKQDQVIVSEEILKAIHGNPLAAIIISQLLIENKDIPIPEKDETFKRFEEQFIKNLIGELDLSSDEKETLRILSVSEVAVEIEFIQSNYPHLISSLESLIESFLVDCNYKESIVHVHPLVADYFRLQMEVCETAIIHREYAEYLEEKYESKLNKGIPDPNVVSQIVHHYAGGLELKKLSAFKGKYVEQLKPIAEQLFRNQKYQEAIEYYLIIFNSLGNIRPDMILRLAQCYVYVDDLSSAEKYFSIAIEKKPRAAYMYAKYSIALAHKFENASMAQTYAFIAEDIYNENKNTYTWELATIKFAQAQALNWVDKKRAYSLYKEACNIEPSNCYYLCTLCRRLVLDNCLEEAKEYYKKSCEINPSYHGNQYLKKFFTQEETFTQEEDFLFYDSSTEDVDEE